MKECHMEIWKEIEGFEGIYWISTWGRVRGTKGILKPYKTEKGYYKVDLYKKGKRHKWRVNRLVAHAFIPNPYSLPQVDHVDGNKQNNSITNLRWVDNSTNVSAAKALRKMARILKERDNK